MASLDIPGLFDRVATAGGDGEAAIDWARSERLALEGLESSKDLRLLAVAGAARLRTAGLTAFLDMLSVAAGWVDRYWSDLYPAPEPRAAARRDALREFANPGTIALLSRGLLVVEPGTAPVPVHETASFRTLAPERAEALIGQLMLAIDAIGRLEAAFERSDARLDLGTLREAIGSLCDRVADASRATGAAPPPASAPAPGPVSRGLPRPAPVTAAPPPAPPPATPSTATGRTVRGIRRAKSAKPVEPLAPRGLPREEAAAASAPPAETAPHPEAAPSAPAAASAPQAAARIACHVLAEMDPQVVVNEVATVDVTLSQEAIAATPGRSAEGTGAVMIDATRKLLVQLVPRVNFTLAPGTQDRIEVDPPLPGQPVVLYFDVTAAHEGDGELWVIVRQNQMGVARLVLKPAVVLTRSSAAAGRLVTKADAIQAPALEKPLDQLDIIEQRIGSVVQYLFRLEMPSLNIFRTFTSPPLETSREDYVNALYKEIETRYVSSYNEQARSADVAAFTAQLQAQGVTIFDRLFPFELQQLLWENRDKIRSVRVVSTEPFIPWEIVHLRQPGVAIEPSAPPRFLGQMGLVRWLHNVDGLPPATLTVRKGRARYMIPDYVDPRLKLPATVNERLYLEETFAAAPIEPQPLPLQDAISKPGSFDLLHLACHGQADIKAIASARLVLEGRDEEELVQTYMSVSTIETYGRLRGADGVQPLVFLNACQAGRAGYQLSGIGGFAQAFLRAGAGAFIGTLWSVGDQPAFYFGKAFYESLRGGASLSEAAIAARDAASRDDATWLAYVVYGHPHARVKSEN